jgi:cobyrinic acid a,c-diamide synthase
MSGNSCRIILAALRGGAGKTLVSMGLSAAWHNQGLNVVPFKKGPDFIDAAWLTHAAGGDCHHLDSFMMPPDRMVSSFMINTAGSDIAVIEGNRGLFDGADVKGSHSTAALARLLKSPVILILDCTKVTRTSAAMVLGCLKFEPELDIKGVILNQIARSRHEDIIANSVKEYCGLPALGAIPKLKEFPMPERHLGLIPPQENNLADKVIKMASSVAEKYLDLKSLQRIARSAPKLKVPAYGLAETRSFTSPPTIGIIRDAAFQFYYPENIEELKRQGARIIEISALSDSRLPEVDALYIGGGFPETHAESLAANERFRASILEAVCRGLPVYAECGGAMYLGESITWREKTYPMVGAYPVSFGWRQTPSAHGYTILETENGNPFFDVGVSLKGHEFHYSEILEWDEGELAFAFKVKRGYGLDGMREGICHKNILATYTHVHVLGSPQWSAALVDAAAGFHKTKESPQAIIQEKNLLNFG